MTLHRVFIGYDPRQPLAYNLCQFSIVKRSTAPVAVSPLMIDQLPLTRVGLTTFTFSRFLVPWLCDYQGWALFMDCDDWNEDVRKKQRYFIIAVRSPSFPLFRHPRRS